MIKVIVLRLHKFIAFLLLVLWTPVVSHCLIEDALGHSESGCCESSGPVESGHSDCSTCLAVESGQAKTDGTILPAPRTLDAAHEVFPLALTSASETRPAHPVIRRADESPPVPPASVILQATLAQPVRGPSLAV